jgi:hypothetical protein
MKVLVNSDRQLHEDEELERIVAQFLSDGYSTDEIAAEFRLTAMEGASLLARTEGDWWQRQSHATKRYLARKRARVLKSTGDDMSVVERLDPNYAPRREQLPQGNTYNVSIASWMLPENRRNVIDAEAKPTLDEGKKI